MTDLASSRSWAVTIAGTGPREGLPREWNGCEGKKPAGRYTPDPIPLSENGSTPEFEESASSRPSFLSDLTDSCGDGRLGGTTCSSEA